MMESSGGGSSAVSAAMPSPSTVDVTKATNYEFDPSLAEEEKRFYVKAYPTVDIVRDRKTHCTVCKVHIGTAPVQENGIKMHPILRVTHCNKCHDFYNSGEFSKGEDGSELYCRWCGQGGEVYCCSSCPYVFCKSCIIKNLSRGVVADIEQNENWNCFSCAPKILWPLRAQHWALMNYIEQQKKEIYSLNLNESDLKQYLSKDYSKCCRLAKAKLGHMSDSLESLDSVASKRSHGSASSAKKPMKHSASPQQMNAAKRAKNNDDIVCTPDLLSMLEPDCQITVSPKPNRPMQSPSVSTPKIMSIQQPQANYGPMSSTPKSSTAPPPLVLRNTAIKLRPTAPQPVVRRTIIGPRTPNPGGNTAPVYHTINGYRIDLNSAAQQETFRLPNGKLIQVKRQGPPAGGPQSSPQMAPSPNNWQQMNSPTPQRVIPQTIASRPVQITQHPYNINIQQQQQQSQQAGQQVVRQYHNNMIGSTTINAVNHNGASIQVLNGQMTSSPLQQQQQQAQQQHQQAGGPIRPVMVRHVFPDNPIGKARTGLQEQVFNAMEICTHLTNKVQTLTNSNAYKQARNYLEVKELYIHLSYLLTYAIGRFKGLQDKCLGDMRTLGFGNDADSLENGQLAAAVDYVCYGQLDDVDLFNTGSNSFHNQVYEYRKSLHANLKDGEDGAKSPLPPLFPLGQGKSEDVDDDDAEGEDSLLEEPKGTFKGHWLEGGEDSPAPPSYKQENEENEAPDESFRDNDDDDTYDRSMARGGNYGGGDSFMQGTEESMVRNEETHAFDRKLTRLVAQYPSIWCIKHPDYGNFEVTRKQWRTIASHFDRNEQIKLRWKNIRKRFVRIEKRIAEGKRFNGHFDKAMAFLANRELPEDQWVPVDCGEDDGYTYERRNLDAIERSLYLQGKDEFVDRAKDRGEKESIERNLYSFQPAVKPIDIEPLDLKIMTFVRCNPVLWRKSMDPEADKIDEETRKTVWQQLQKTMPQVSSEYIKDRWQHLYEMYKTFRLKTIKSNDDRANLELKYSKYLAKLYFLYKIDEHELKNENNGLFEDCFELEEDEEAENDADEEEGFDSDQPKPQESQTKLQDMPDDKEFLLELVKLVKEYPAIWNTNHEDYNDIMIRDNFWQEINEKLQDFKHKQASDDEDNEIEIVEPKTDLINLDSDDDEPASSPAKKLISPVKGQKMFVHSPTAEIRRHIPAASLAPGGAKIQHIVRPAPQPPQRPPAPAPAPVDENMDLMSMAQSFLASMLEVDIHEGPGVYNASGGFDPSGVKKQPRKKLTNKPNPTLLKQKAIMERERLEEMKRNDQKLKMKCAVALKKAEDEFPKEMLEAKAKKEEEELKEKERRELEAQNKLVVDMGKELLEVEVVLEEEDDGEDVINSSNEEKIKNKEATTELSKEEDEEDEDDEEKTTDKNNKSIENLEDDETRMDADDNEETETSLELKEKDESMVGAKKDKSVEEIDEIDKSIEIIEKEKSLELSDNNEESKPEEEIDETINNSKEVEDDLKDKSIETDDELEEKTIDDKVKEKPDQDKLEEKSDQDELKEKFNGDKQNDKIVEKEKSMEEEKEKTQIEDEEMEIQDEEMEKEESEETINDEEKEEQKNDDSPAIIDDEKPEAKETETKLENNDKAAKEEIENPPSNETVFDEIEENSTNGIKDIDKINEEMETDEDKVKSPPPTTDQVVDEEEPMDIDDKESLEKSNTIQEIDTSKSLNLSQELDVDKEIEKVLQKQTDEDDKESKEEEEIDEIENITSKVLLDNEKELPTNNSPNKTQVTATITPTNEIEDLPSKEQDTIEIPPIEAESTATTTSTTTPSNGNTVVS